MLSRDQAARNWAYNLNRLREKQELSQYELAKLAGIVSDNEKMTVNTRAITRYEMGMLPRLDHLGNIAEVLGVRCESLFLPKAPAGFFPPKPTKKRRKKRTTAA